MSDSFDAEEGPTRPAAAARKSKTSRWRAVANTAIQRGFGRLSEGDFDQGNPRDENESENENGNENESGTRIVAARSEAETLPAPEPSAARGPRGTVRIEVPGVRGPTGTMRIAPVRRARRAEPARPPWWSIAGFAALSLAMLAATPRSPRDGSAPISDIAAPDVAAAEVPPPPAGPSDPPQPPSDFVPADAPAASPEQPLAVQQPPLSHKHDNKKTRAKPPVRTRRARPTPSASGVL